MPVPLALRGLIAFVDRALAPATATRNAQDAAASLAEHIRQVDEVERDIRSAKGGGPSE